MPEQTELTAAGAAPGLGLAASRTFGAVAEPVLVGLGGLLLVSAVAASDGGYFAGSWSVVALATFFLATLRLLLSPYAVLERLDLALLVLLAAFAGWIALSALWAPAFTPVMGELTRMLAYLGAVLLALLLVRRSTVGPLLGGLLAGVTLVTGYALATRLAPDRIGSWDPVSGYRLADPIGYWNGLGVFAAMGTLLALGLVARSSSRLARAGAGLAPPVLVTTMLFTFSRGAWLALAVGLVAAFALDPRRLQYAAAALVLAPWCAIPLLVATSSDVLTNSHATVAQVVDEGGGFALLVVGMALVSATAAVVLGEVGDRVAIPRGARTGFSVLLAALAVAGVGVLWSSEGAPWRVANRVWGQFTAPPKATGADVTERLFDLSANGRIELWRVSWHAFEADPVAGSGAGSFAATWFRERPGTLFFSREGHGLYTETLGELGLVGLLLLAVALAVPLVAAVRRRRDPWMVAALATYAAFLAHAGVDWDWELAGVTLVAILAGVALVVSARRRDGRRALSRPASVAAPIATGVLAAVSFVLVLGNVPLDRARVANKIGNWTVAADEADRAVRFAPWSSAALQQRAVAEVGLGQVDAARGDFRRAVAKSPNDYELWVDYAGILQGRAAQAALRRAIALNPRDASIREALAQRTASR